MISLNVKNALFLFSFFTCGIQTILAQDANFNTPLNNRTFYHPSYISVLSGFEAGAYAQSIFFGVRPNPKNNHAYLNGSYKIGKGVYLGHGASLNYDTEGASPRIATTSLKVNAINFRWFYRKNEKINCDNFFTMPNVTMGYYIGVFNRSLNNGDLIFSKQIAEWTQTPIRSDNPELFQSVTKTDFGGTVAVQFPISRLFKWTNDFWIGNICYSMHHLQSPRRALKPTEASFIISDQNVVLPRYHVWFFSVLNKHKLHKEIFFQFEKQQPIRRLLVGYNFFLNPQLAFTVTASSHNVGKWLRNINTLVLTANAFTRRKEVGRDQIISKFYISYASVLTGIGISPLVNRFGSVQVGLKFSRNKDCLNTTTDCPVL